MRIIIKPHCLLTLFIVLITVCVAGVPCDAQVPAPESTPPNREPQERVKVFTEEIVIPVSAYDHSGHLNPFLEPEDIVVFEDDVPQQVRSIRRVPANVFLMLDTAGELNPAMRVSTTREIATRLISNLQATDRIAALQFGGGVKLLQDWTTDKEEVVRTLKTRLFSSKRSSLASALLIAVARLSARSVDEPDIRIGVDIAPSGRGSVIT